MLEMTVIILAVFTKHVETLGQWHFDSKENFFVVQYIESGIMESGISIL